MFKGLENCNYDKIKILHHMSKMLWFIEKHALEDAKKMSDEKCYAAFEEIKKDLEKHVEKLKHLVAKDYKA